MKRRDAAILALVLATGCLADVDDAGDAEPAGSGGGEAVGGGGGQGGGHAGGHLSEGGHGDASVGHGGASDGDGGRPVSVDVGVGEGGRPVAADLGAGQAPLPDASAPRESELVSSGGQMLLAVSTFLRPEYPFLFAAMLRPDAPGEDGGPTLELQPLYCKNEGGEAPNCTREPVGALLGPFDFSASDDGVFLVELGEVTLIGDANPVSGRDIKANLEFRGHLVGDGLCGDVRGDIVEPIPADLLPEENTVGAVYLGPLDAAVDFEMGPVKSSCDAVEQ